MAINADDLHGGIVPTAFFSRLFNPTLPEEEFHHGLEDPPAYVASDDSVASTADSGSAHEPLPGNEPRL
jgi:hypothetical protein